MNIHYIMGWIEDYSKLKHHPDIRNYNRNGFWMKRSDRLDDLSRQLNLEITRHINEFNNKYTAEIVTESEKIIEECRQEINDLISKTAMSDLSEDGRPAEDV